MVRKEYNVNRSLFSTIPLQSLNIFNVLLPQKSQLLLKNNIAFWLFGLSNRLLMEFQNITGKYHLEVCQMNYEELLWISSATHFACIIHPLLTHISNTFGTVFTKVFHHCGLWVLNRKSYLGAQRCSINRLQIQIA